MFDESFAPSLIESFGGPYTVIRRTSGLMVKGRATPGTESEIAIVASIQPLRDGRQLLRLPEERRTIETRIVYTITRLLLGGQGEATKADLIVIGAERWEVQDVAEWPGHFVCLIQVTV